MEYAVIIGDITVREEKKMKRTAIFVLIIILALSILAACRKPDNSGDDSPAAFDPAQVKTMEDIFAYADTSSYNDIGYTETEYICVFEADGIYYRAIAELPADVSETLWAIDFFDENRDQKERELISPLAVKSIENLSDQILSQEELDQLAGRTGQDLFDDGWTYWAYNLENMEASMNYGPFSYNVQFDYSGEQMDNTDDFDFYEAFKDLKVLSVTFEGPGNATE